MKNRTLKVLSLVSLLVLAASAVALAADSISVPVSVTIPAVPGLNAPPFNTEAAATADNSAAGETRNIQEETIRQTSAGSTTIQTIYSR